MRDELPVSRAYVHLFKAMQAQSENGEPPRRLPISGMDDAMTLAASSPPLDADTASRCRRTTRASTAACSSA